jgi:hypothetical protein
MPDARSYWLHDPTRTDEACNAGTSRRPGCGFKRGRRV